MTNSGLLSTEIVDAVRRSQSIVVLTGAGVSAESGVPTFRDAQTGLWAQFRPEDLATPEAFRKDPRRVWEWYAWRRELVAKALPNPAHTALADLQRLVPGFRLITQNVDGLHQRAGSHSVLELHGNLTRTKCFDEDLRVETWGEQNSVPPRCPRCGGHLRPDVVWFNEALPADVLEAAQHCAQACDVFLSVGTSSLVYPAASLPFIALEHAAVVLEINPTETPLSQQATWAIRAPAGEILPALVRQAWPSPT